MARAREGSQRGVCAEHFVQFPEVRFTPNVIQNMVIVRLSLTSFPGEAEQKPGLASFQHIFEMFESERFAIVTRADPIELSNFCTRVDRWEERAGIRF
jgi:hypothetical protein